MKQLKDFPPEVLAFTCGGLLTALDYRQVLEPAIEEAARDNAGLRLLYRIDKDFAGVEPGAMFEDARVGFAHLTQWERIAVVTDISWIAFGVQAFGFLTPGKVRTFRLAEMDQAKAWIAEQPVR